METLPYGFRIVGDCRQPRLPICAAVALAGHAACDARAELDHECYLSAFQFGWNFVEQLRSTGSTAGYKGPCWSPWLWFDIDREGDIEAALRDARRLAAGLTERYCLDDDALLLFFSGSKGFHVGLPTALWRPPPGKWFHNCARQFAETAAQRLGVVIDTGVYDKVRAFRAPNSRHPKTGRHKRRFAYDELLNLKCEAIIERSAEPQQFGLPQPPALNSQAAADWEAAAKATSEAVAARRNRRAARQSASLNRATLGFIREGATEGDRHRLLFSAAANLGEFGCPSSLAHALLTEAALDSGLPPSEVRRQIDCGLSHADSLTDSPAEVTQ